MIKIILTVVGLFVAFIVWRIFATIKGSMDVQNAIELRSKPIIDRIKAGDPVSKEEVAGFAASPEVRSFLFEALRDLKRPDLLPEMYVSSVDQGASSLAVWMMHPAELKGPPVLLEWIETLKRKLGGEEREFHVYRFKMPEGHWAGNDWILGLAGPMPTEGEPYAKNIMAFSRCDDIGGQVEPSALVDWWVEVLKKKGLFDK